MYILIFVIFNYKRHYSMNLLLWAPNIICHAFKEN